MMAYPDVGQRKTMQLKALEKAHAKLNRPFDPFDFVDLSRKSLSHIMHELTQEISQQNRKQRRAGVMS